MVNALSGPLLHNRSTYARPAVVEVIEPATRASAHADSKTKLAQVRKSKTSGGFFKLFNTNIIRRRAKPSHTRSQRGFTYDDCLSTRSMPTLSAFYPGYSPGMFQGPFMYPPFVTPQQYQAMNYAWQHGANPAQPMTLFMLPPLQSSVKASNQHQEKAPKVRKKM